MNDEDQMAMEEDKIIRAKMKKDMMDVVLKVMAHAKMDDHITKAKKYDVSASLPDDAKAKLQLAYGDFVIIPCDKLKDYKEDLR